MFESHGKMMFDKFRGLFDRGREEACPPDYLLECKNFIFEQDSLKIRRGQYQVMTSGQSLGEWPFTIADVFRVLKSDGTEAYLISGTNSILYYTGWPSPLTNTIAAIGGWNGSFNAVQIGNRIYFMPLDGVSYLYVFDITWPVGTKARWAGASPPTGSQITLAPATLASVGTDDPPAPAPPLPPLAPEIVAANAGIDAGFHIIAVLFETDTGFITSFLNHAGSGPPALFDGTQAVTVANIPLGDPAIHGIVTKRHLIATKLIPSFDGDPTHYEFFFIPTYGEIKDNTTLSRIVWWKDAGLVDSADIYTDQLTHVPNARRVTLYNGRLVVAAPTTDRNACYISRIGEPESFDKVNSILIFDPKTYRGIEDVAEHRGNLYLFSDTSTAITQDDDTNPNEWRVISVDKSRGIAIGNHDFNPSIAVGQYNHQPVAIDGQLICYSNGGLHTFDGAFREDLAWAIKDRVEGFPGQHPTLIVNPTSKSIIFGNPGEMYVGDYSEGMTAANIKWNKIALNNYGSPWKQDPVGLYQLYGDGKNVIACTQNRIFGWSRLMQSLHDTYKDAAGTNVNPGAISIELKFPHVYPNDGWVYQFNEIVSRIETAPSIPSGVLTVTLHSLDAPDYPAGILGAGFLAITSNKGQIQRKWFNFKSEACSILITNEPPVDLGAEIKNISISFKQLWGSRPRSLA